MRSSHLITPEAAVEIFNPERLRHARLAEGVLQADLADDAGVTSAAISQYENGHARPSAEVLSRMASGLGYPLAYFTAGRPSLDVTEHTWHFRSLASTTKREQARAARRAAHVWEVATFLAKYVNFPVFDIPDIPATEATQNVEIINSARHVRDALDVPRGPVVDVVRLLEAHGVIVARLATETRKVDAFSSCLSTFPVVVLGRDKNDKARSRFDAAHELGHLVLHRNFTGQLRTREEQAQLFAAEFLMPEFDIRGSLPDRVDFAELLRLKSTWGTSVQALLYRARELSCLTESRYRRAVTRLSRLGWRDNEPGDLGPPEEPELLATALHLAREQGIDVQHVAASTALPVEFVKELVESKFHKPSLRSSSARTGPHLVSVPPSAGMGSGTG